MAQATERQFDITEADARTGSHIKRSLTLGSSVPINRTYAELSPEERNLLNSYYDRVEPGEEPPFPLEGLKPIHSAMAKVQQKLLVSGNLTLEAAVDAAGNVTDVRAIGSPSKELSQAAASIILLSKFKPAICAGQPCKMEFPFRVAFEVR